MKKFILIGICAVLLLAGCSASPSEKSLLAPEAPSQTEVKSDSKDNSNEGNSKEIENEKPPVYKFDDLSLTLLDGTKSSLYAYEGKTIVLNFWTTDCTYCSQLMPHLNTLDKRDDVVVLSVNTGSNADEVNAYLEGKNYDFEVFLDEDSALYNSLALRGVPMTFFISPQYELYLLQQGYVDEKGLESIMTSIEAFEKNNKGE